MPILSESDETVNENELIANKLAGRIYCGNFTGGKYISVISVDSGFPLENEDIAIISVSPRVELRISYIGSHNDTSGFKLKKIKKNSSSHQWEADGEIVLSTFTIADLAGLSELLSKISLKNISQSRIDIDDLTEIDDENELEKQLRSIAATSRGRKIISAIAKTQSISETDIINVAYRREQLEIFKLLLEEEDFFNSKKTEWGCGRDEDVWQKFFEDNPWIFGYGLSLISCESFDDQRMEQMVSGATAFQPGGKRIDALLKTRGFIKSLMFTEIKTHRTPLLKSSPYRPPDTYQISSELSGACSQVQKTIHKTLLSLGANSIGITNTDGSPTGEEVAITQPRGIVIVGSLKEFEEENGINFEKFTSFELSRRNLENPEILTFDELYERAKFIVNNDPEASSVLIVTQDETESSENTDEEIILF